VGFDGPDFINMVVAFRAAESIEELLVKLRRIEEMCGRPRNSPKWASRAMDLDVLMFGSRIEKTADFTLPRPDLLKRPYMLGPMAEIAADVLHPTAGKTIGELWAEFDREAHAMVPANIDLPAAAN
jgi:2-amino-4-hydroxy-6-hydroxymethyldihydropteridine diphosphokinase